MFKHRSHFRHFLDVWPGAFNWLLQNGNLCVTALLDFSLIKVEVLILLIYSGVLFLLSFNFPETFQSLPVPSSKVTAPASRRRVSSSDSDPGSESPPKGSLNYFVYKL